MVTSQVWVRVDVIPGYCTFTHIIYYMYYTYRNYIEITSLFGYESVWVRVDVYPDYYTIHMHYFIS